MLRKFSIPRLPLVTGHASRFAFLSWPVIRKAFAAAAHLNSNPAGTDPRFPR